MRSLILCPIAVSGLLLCLESNAQVFRLTGGASTGFQAQGAGIEVRGKGYEAWSGAGLSDGHLIVGSFVKMHFLDYTLKFGNDDVAMTLPIDVFGTQSTLHTNGISVDKKIGKTAIHAFTGRMGTAFTSPMFRAGTTSGPPATILFTDTLLTENLRLFSRNIFSSTQTIIGGAEWKAHGRLPCMTRSDIPLLRDLKCDLDPGFTLSLAAGVGSGHIYTSEALSLSRDRLDLNLAHVFADDGFQRSLSGTPLQSELDGANVTGTVRPTIGTSFSFGHQNYLIPQQDKKSTLHAQVDRASGSWKLGEYNGTATGAAVFRSAYINRATRGASLWASQTLGPIDLRLNYLVSQSDGQAPLQSIALTSQEKLTPRLSALQVTTFSGGKTSVAFGGSLLTNLLTVGVNYQTLYVPFRPDNPFTQTLSITLNLSLRGNIHLSTATSFTPEGKMIYTLAGSGSYYRLAGLEAAPPMQSFRLQQYVINGQVTTPDGLPVYGAAVRIGKETVYSDRDGRFFARERKPGQYKVEVVIAEFIATGDFTVVSAPADVAATKDPQAPGIVIVIAHSDKQLAVASPL
ncbi:MAG: hypothetical protein JWQ42_2327 [Edaphobacter sp.]|nr:hypothetical protein [Edaphobacter sp.]